MKPRFNYARCAPSVYDALAALDDYLYTCGLEESLLQRLEPGAYQPALSAVLP